MIYISCSTIMYTVCLMRHCKDQVCSLASLLACFLADSALSSKATGLQASWSFLVASLADDQGFQYLLAGVCPVFSWPGSRLSGV